MTRSQSQSREDVPVVQSIPLSTRAQLHPTVLLGNQGFHQDDLGALLQVTRESAGWEEMLAMHNN